MPNDHSQDSILKHFDPISNYIYQAIIKGESCLIHGFADLSECFVFAGAYMIKKENFNAH